MVVEINGPNLKLQHSHNWKVRSVPFVQTFVVSGITTAPLF